MSTYLKVHAKGKEYLERSYGSKHMDQHRAKRELKKKNVQLDYWFTIVRNPLDRLVSAYHYYLRQKTMKYSSFEEYVRSTDWGCVKKQQSKYIDDTCHVFRFENMDEVYATISSRLCSVSSPGKKLNPSHHDDYRTYYTDELAEIVYKQHSEDFDRFSYDRFSDYRKSRPINNEK